MEDHQDNVHIIRIHAAWERVEIDTGMTASSAKKVALPDENPIAATTALIVYTRRFNRPSGLGMNHRVELECSLRIAANAASLNGHAIVVGDDSTIDVTSLLRPHNELKFTVPASLITSACSGTARLVITAS